MGMSFTCIKLHGHGMHQHIAPWAWHAPTHNTRGMAHTVTQNPWAWHEYSSLLGNATYYSSWAMACTSIQYRWHIINRHTKPWAWHTPPHNTMGMSCSCINHMGKSCTCIKLHGHGMHQHITLWAWHAPAHNSMGMACTNTQYHGPW